MATIDLYRADAQGVVGPSAMEGALPHCTAATVRREINGEYSLLDAACHFLGWEDKGLLLLIALSLGGELVAVDANEVELAIEVVNVDGKVLVVDVESKALIGNLLE